MAILPWTHQYSGLSDSCEIASPDSGTPASVPLADAQSPLGVYTARHRDAWPLLLRTHDAEALRTTEPASWLRLWGQLGSELYECFRMGDAHIRTDMINLARDEGGWRGRLVADSLERWRRTLGDC